MVDGGGNGGGSKYVSSVATFDSQWENDGDGYINLKFTTATDIAGITTSKTVTNVVSGTKTDTLTINSDSVGIQTVSVTITQPDATNSPLTSDTVNFAAVSNANQYNVNVEAIGIANTATLSSVNLLMEIILSTHQEVMLQNQESQTTTAFMHLTKI